MLPSLGCLRPAWVIPAVLLLGGAPLRGQTPDRAVTIPRVEQPPRIEDFLAGGALSHGGDNGTAGVQGIGARITDFRQREPGDGVPVSQATTAYVSYDDANLYVIFVCTDEPAQVRAQIARREEIGSDDQVVVYLDTFRDRERAYFFMTNPLGVQLDGIQTEGQSIDLSFDAVWHSEGRLTRDGYVVRMAIPFRSLRFPRAPTQSWGIALGRMIRRNNEGAYWPHITERIKGFVPQFAVAQGFADISPGRNIQVNPYTTLARARILDEDVPGFRTLGDERVGLDAKTVLRDALTVDGTVNPDFSQVETDDPQVTVNQRFEVFFPEKRPFFIENSGYFSTPVNLLFSRRIVDPGAGLRLSGKLGRWSVGAIAMNDRAPGHVPAPDPLAGARAQVGALRVQHELGEESTIGALVTDRELEGTVGRAFSLDSRVKLSKTWSFSGQVIHGETRDQGTRRSGFGALAEVERDGRKFDYSAKYVQFDPGFSVPLGFVQRGGIREMEHKWKYRWRPGGSAVLNYGPEVKAAFVWGPGGRQLDREIGAEFTVELVGETDVKVERVEVFELFDGAPFHPHNTQVSFGTQWIKWLALDASYAWGAAVNHDPAAGQLPFMGRTAEVEVKVTLRPTPRLRMDQTYIHSRFNTTSGQRVFTERLLRAKVNYQFSRFLSLRAIVDYDAEGGDTTLADIEDDKRWRGDVLLTYLVNPGTALHVGYTDRYENLGLVPGTPPTVERRRRADTSTARQLFVKLSYLWRF